MFAASTTDADFHGGGDVPGGGHSDEAEANFGSKAWFDVIGGTDGTTFSNPHVEDQDDSTDDFHLGTAQFDTGGCYGRPGMADTDGGVANCWGTYDKTASGNTNMCTRLAPLDGSYAPPVQGYWYIWVR